MNDQIRAILLETLPTNSYIQIEKSEFHHNLTKIIIAASSIKPNNCKDQYIQAVNLFLNTETLVCSVRDQTIYLTPDKTNEKEKYNAQTGVKIAFRKPKTTEKAVLLAIQKFAERWVVAMRENKDRLIHSELVDYDLYLK